MKRVTLIFFISINFFLNISAQNTASISLNANDILREKPVGIGGTMIEYHDAPSPFVVGNPYNFQADVRKNNCQLIRMGAYPSLKNMKQTLNDFDDKVLAIINSGAKPLFYVMIKPNVSAYYKTDGKLGGNPASNLAFLVNHYKNAPFNLSKQIWEVGNEPENTVDYKAGSDEYSETFKACHDTLVKQGIRENVQLAGPVLSITYLNSTNYRDGLFENFIEKCHDYVDLITFHNYGITVNPFTPTGAMTKERSLSLLNDPQRLDNIVDGNRVIDVNISGSINSNRNNNQCYMGLAGMMKFMRKYTYARGQVSFGITEQRGFATNNVIHDIHTLESGLFSLASTHFLLYNNDPQFPSILDNLFILSTKYDLPIYNPDYSYDYANWSLWMNGNLRGNTMLKLTTQSPLNSYKNALLLTTASKNADGTVFLEVINRDTANIKTTISCSNFPQYVKTAIHEMSNAKLPNTETEFFYTPNFTYIFPRMSVTVFKFQKSNVPIITANQEEENLVFSAYPNPCKNDSFFVKSSQISKAKISFFNTLGQEISIKIQEINKETYQISSPEKGFKTGIYFLNLLINNQKYVKKIIIAE